MALENPGCRVPTVARQNMGHLVGENVPEQNRRGDWVGRCHGVQTIHEHRDARTTLRKRMRVGHCIGMKVWLGRPGKRDRDRPMHRISRTSSIFGSRRPPLQRYTDRGKYFIRSALRFHHDERHGLVRNRRNVNLDHPSRGSTGCQYGHSEEKVRKRCKRWQLNFNSARVAYIFRRSLQRVPRKRLLVFIIAATSRVADVYRGLLHRLTPDSSALSPDCCRLR